MSVTCDLLVTPVLATASDDFAVALSRGSMDARFLVVCEGRLGALNPDACGSLYLVAVNFVGLLEADLLRLQLPVIRMRYEGRAFSSPLRS
ncbi:hypothetical protein LX32DRAFT_639750 [Colletotrichum zoysiae]|uniref:Uncharacterized protein n=1 Tax=Colletotrichum zoysiae TaxID=1216348 RepID=A0AAD9HGY4_9PEZI|nr:hypothetical protein LX32DRAFT_639750 [Colletotrichum zoysiae]